MPKGPVIPTARAARHFYCDDEYTGVQGSAHIDGVMVVGLFFLFALALNDALEVLVRRRRCEQRNYIVVRAE